MTRQAGSQSSVQKAGAGAQSKKSAMMASVATVATLLLQTPALAQETPAPTTSDAPQPVATTAPATAAPAGSAQVLTADRQIYTPADFTRYAPKNAYDMLSQVPGFGIRDNEDLRGLGQATGNVLFNGKRPSNKGDDMVTQLTRIPANNVTRIEIVDGATLDIPGLSGQVANIVYSADGLTGQFAWRPQFRAHYTDPLFTRGNVSLRGRDGALEYEVALNNEESSRSGAGGPTWIHDGKGALIEERNDDWHTHYDTPKLAGKLTWTAANGNIANLGGHYQYKIDRYHEISRRDPADDVDRERSINTKADSWNYEINGDYQFNVGPGKLKLIGLNRYSREPYWEEVITRFADDRQAEGDRFAQTGKLGETIARAEYQWKMFGGDWQLSGEGAFNSLDNVASLGTLINGEFDNQPFVGATGGVREDRYEGMLSFGRKLTDKLSFQLIAGAEHSTISQTGAEGTSRRFFRPKGSLSLAWTPSPDLDIAFKARRRVLQLDFYDFLARAFLDDGNANQSNSDLRPQQDWSYDLEINKKLGAWGSTKLYFIYRDVEDRVDIIRVGDGEGVGNIAKAKASAVEWTSTINLDPAGLKGMKLEGQLLFQKSSLRDPFTTEKRQWNGFTDRAAELSLRHDVPGTDWAWGSGIEYSHDQPVYRRNQVDHSWEGPIWLNAFVEHKNVMGLTVRAQIINIANARSRRDRTVYEGLRGDSPVAFTEDRNRLIGPVFAFSVKGNI